MIRYHIYQSESLSRYHISFTSLSDYACLGKVYHYRYQLILPIYVKIVGYI